MPLSDETVRDLLGMGDDARCRRHEWVRALGPSEPDTYDWCNRCGASRDEVEGLDVERIFRERLADLRSCRRNDDCSMKAEGIELALSDVEYERASRQSDESDR